MTVLYLDCFSGVAGDMLLGALFDLGVGPAIESAVSALALPGVHLDRRTVERSGIRAVKIDVQWSYPQPERDHASIQELLSRTPLDPKVRKLASATFHRLAEAEGEVHGVPPERVHFHEVGSVDAIVDVVGASAGFVALGATVVSSPLPLGGGLVRAAHGPLPVPGPATLLLLRGVPVRGTDHQVELVTPTGAALVSAVAESWGPLPPMRPRAVGHGAGTMDLADRPNVVRAVLGDEVVTIRDEVLSFEANVDDMTPEVAAHAAERMREAGALDVWIVPIVMKKGRPGLELRALCREERREAVAGTIMRETTTLGLRIARVSRIEAERAIVEVDTPWGPVPVKVGSLGGEEISASPELEACRTIADRAGVPLKRVLAEAMASYLRRG